MGRPVTPLGPPTDARFLRLRRYNVLLLTWLAYCAYVASRRPFGVVRHDLQQRLELSTFQLGLMDTLFLANYCIGQFFYGAIKDILSPTRSIAIGLLGCALWLSLFARSRTSGPAAFAFWWALNGLFNAFGWPSCMRIVTPWVAPEERGRIMGLWASCQAAGGIVGNASASYFLGLYGWEAAVQQGAVFVGGVGLLNWAFLIEHPARVGYEPRDGSAQQARDSEAPSEGGAEPARESMGPLAALRVPGVAPVALAHFCEKIIRYTVLFWLPYYLTRRLQYDQVVAGYAAAAFDVGGVLGSVLSGLVADRWARGTRRVTVSALFIAAAGASLLPFAVCPGALAAEPESPLRLAAPVAAAFCVGLFLLGFDSLLTGAVIQDLASNAGVPQHVSAVSGVIGGTGTFGSILQGTMTTALTAYLSWEALWLVLVALVCAAVLFVFPVISMELRTRSSAGKGAP